MLRAKAILLIAFIVMFGGTGPVQAGLTRIDVDPTPIIALGDTATYTAVIDNLDGPATYKWSYKRILSDCGNPDSYTYQSSTSSELRTQGQRA